MLHGQRLEKAVQPHRRKCERSIDSDRTNRVRRFGEIRRTLLTIPAERYRMLAGSTVCLLTPLRRDGGLKRKRRQNGRDLYLMQSPAQSVGGRVPLLHLLAMFLSRRAEQRARRVQAVFRRAVERCWRRYSVQWS